MPNDRPDFTRAGCTRSFLGGQGFGTTAPLLLLVYGLPAGTGIHTVLPAAAGPYFVFSWGVGTMSAAQKGFFTLRTLVATETRAIDSLLLSNETASNRPQGIKVDLLNLRWTRVTPTPLFVSVFLIYAKA